MLKKKIFTLSVLILGLSFPIITRAICPVCTIAVATGVGLCRWLGISDLISGTWIGALIVSMIGWTINWIRDKKFKFRFHKIVITAFYYFIIVAPLYWAGIIGHPFNKFWGIDKLLFGIGAGTIVFILALILNYFLKKKNQGKAFFPFQKVVVPIVLLIIISLIFYFAC
jgi:hypothetical protein